MIFCLEAEQFYSKLGGLRVVRKGFAFFPAQKMPFYLKVKILLFAKEIKISLLLFAVHGDFVVPEGSNKLFCFKTQNLPPSLLQKNHLISSCLIFLVIWQTLAAI